MDSSLRATGGSSVMRTAPSALYYYYYYPPRPATASATSSGVTESSNPDTRSSTDLVSRGTFTLSRGARTSRSLSPVRPP